jgi:DNA-binding transcriptional LysR family regulator
MRFRSYDHLRLFNVVARHLSFTTAASELNLTKGAVSYQIRQLEDELGFEVFSRRNRGIVLTTKGQKLLYASKAAFNDLESEINQLRQLDSQRITIGMSTYFASRWLSPRLMNFMASHAAVGLRIQPLIDLNNLSASNIDMAIRWGKGDWQDKDTTIELILPCPAKPTAGAIIAKAIRVTGIKSALAGQTLLHDRDDSNAWLDWYMAAGLSYPPDRDDLVIPDPNVRVQAVIDNQGVALNDSLVDAELAIGQLFQISDVELADYGYYLVYLDGTLKNPAMKAFRDWIMLEAERQVENG